MIIAECIGITLEYESKFYAVRKKDGVRFFAFAQCAANAFAQEINMALIRRIKERGIPEPTPEQWQAAPNFCEEHEYITTCGGLSTKYLKEYGWIKDC